MDKIDFLDNQSQRRDEYLDKILDSPSPRKLIVSGPGTGKTFTFGEVLKKVGGNQNLALTFIRKLVAEMEREIGTLADVRTFHRFCKKLLHEAIGAIELAPYLTQVIREDANLLGMDLSEFERAFQLLDEGSKELSFYIERGNYYNAVSFDDSVYRVYRAVQEGRLALPAFGQVVIDEFQDFNPLEVAIIDELQKASPILIVGDDDQAVYRRRNSSPDYLREKFHSGDYEVFELPFNSRSPRVITEATSSLIKALVTAGGFAERIERDYVPYIEGREYENSAYPKIVSATTSNVYCTSAFISLAIKRIPKQDVLEAHEKNYPCVLIVGSRQYRNHIYKRLVNEFENVSLKYSEAETYSLSDAYDLLLKNEDSNLGWRILAAYDLDRPTLRAIVQDSVEGKAVRSAIPDDLQSKHLSVLKILKNEDPTDSDLSSLEKMVGDEFQLVTERFFPKVVGCAPPYSV